MDNFTASALSIIAFLPMFYFAYHMTQPGSYEGVKALQCLSALDALLSCQRDGCSSALPALVFVNDSTAFCEGYAYPLPEGFENGLYRAVECEGGACRPK